MAEKQKILIVDDDTNISGLIALYLMKECFEAETAADGEEALRLFAEFTPDLVLLDIMLPGMDGYEVCRKLRAVSSVPVIMLSAKGETFDKVLGLELGADDYIVKPFDSKELVARVKAVLRRGASAVSGGAAASGDGQGATSRSSSHSGAEQTPGNRGKDDQTVSYEGLTVSLSDYRVTYLGKNVEMPPKELELLYYLASNPNRVFTRDQLLNSIWGYEYVGDSRTVDVHIKRLREKIHDHAGWSIGTVWRVGYRFEVR